MTHPHTLGSQPQQSTNCHHVGETTINRRAQLPSEPDPKLGHWPYGNPHADAPFGLLVSFASGGFRFWLVLVNHVVEIVGGIHHDTALQSPIGTAMVGVKRPVAAS